MEARFDIDSETYLSIPFEKNLAEITEAEEAPINLVHKGIVKLTLCGNYEFGTPNLSIDTWCALVNLKNQLELVLTDKLELQNTWDDLTKIVNDYLQSIPPIPDQSFKEHDIHQHIMWRPHDLPVTLLYNHNKNIILEIVPRYNRSNNNTHYNKTHYNTFLQNSATLAKYVIPREKAKEWLRKAIDLKETMEA